MKIKKFFLCITLLSAVGLGSFACYKYFIYRNTTVSQGNSRKTNIKTPEDNIPQVNTPETPAPAPPHIIYDIRGKSNKLSPKEWKAMQEARSREVEIAKNNPDMVFINGYTDKKICALTFDDGPDGTVMPKILDILKKNSINASFFLIGNQVKAYKNVVKRTYEEGNLVLNHSFTHPDFFKLSEKDIKKQLSETEDVIYGATGKRPAIIRPPYGSLNDTIISTSRALDYHIAIWSTDTLDWSQKEKDNIVKNVVDNIRPGEIILMHCNSDKKATAEALPIIISELRDKGYSFVTLDKLLNIQPYK